MTLYDRERKHKLPQIMELGSDKKWRKGLLPREQAFITEYLIDFNGTAAATRCGYAPGPSSRDTAHKLLRKPEVRRAIGYLFDKRGITAQRILEEYANVAFANATDYVQIKDGKVVVSDTDEWSPEQKRAVVEISESITAYGTAVKVKFADKLRALDSLAKVRGMFKEHVEVSGTVQHEHAFTRDAIQQTIEGLFSRLADRQQQNEPEFKVIEALPAPDEVKE